ncbi:MAG: DUF188 domain-containing protein [Parafannyhessea umbonata]|uniref:YaiI/YqxD family protein n=1 Tax=Parafannyhessea umbonata TaxID=604330 RepID=UPI0026F2741F|nr:DUF188 domain-containing protein [Parafannyhessea umbonata]MDD6565395.1 DUF188 domain-containing protein [Parafannyhessea umbonata]
MTRLYIDADACPVTREALAVARELRIPCVIAGNTTQNLERSVRATDPREPRDSQHPDRGFWVRVLQVGVGADSADFAIVSELTPEDVVVTQDIGLADMVLGRGARAIGVRGRVYSPLTIDSLMLIRHEEKKVRRAGGRTRGPAAFTSEDRARFRTNLRRLLKTPPDERTPHDGQTVASNPDE